MKLFLVCLLSGLAAGVGTGFVGLSAATVIAPMLIAYLDCPWYEAVGIGLASDVLASAFSAYIYRKNGNIDLKHGILMACAVLSATVVGSYFSQYMPDSEMSWFTVFASIFLGLRFIILPAEEKRPAILIKTENKRTLLSILCGLGIGFYCGFMGAGGGLMMLFIFTSVLGYELKTAVGTSVFVMAFTAFTGAASHFYFGEMMMYIPALLLCSLFTLIGALATASLANRMSHRAANRATGTTLLVLGVFMIVEMLTDI